MKSSSIIILIISLHILINLKTQSGYIHPDEFFQTIEIAAGNVFNYTIIKPWEFNSENPIRSHAIVEIFLNIPLKLFTWFCDLLSIDYCILTFIRLLTASYSLINIPCLFVISPHPKLSIFLYATSYIPLVFLNRAFSNCWELQILSLFFILHSRKPTAKIQFLEGIIISLGVFCRPTFLLFVAPFLLQTIFRLSLRQTVNYAVNGLFGFLSLSICLVSIDTLKYRRERMELGGGVVSDCRMFLHNIVVVPLNFVLYNIDSDNLRTHGEHARLTHALVNLPLLLGPLFLVSLLSLFHLRQSVHIRRLLLSILFPLVSLSLLPHQEMRFLLPLFPLIITLVSATLSQYSTRRRTRTAINAVVAAHIVFSLCLALFWGYLHEAGLLRAAEIVREDVRASPPHLRHLVVSYKTLILPRFLFQIDRLDSGRVDVVNLMGATEEVFFKSMETMVANERPLSTVLHLLYPRAHAFMDHGRLGSIGAPRAAVRIPWHINTDLWRSNVSLSDFTSLQYLSFSL